MDYAQANPGGALNPAQLLLLIERPSQIPSLIHFPPGHAMHTLLPSEAWQLFPGGLASEGLPSSVQSGSGPWLLE